MSFPTSALKPRADCSEGEVASIVVVAKVVCVHINKNVLTKSADGDDVADISKLKPVSLRPYPLSSYNPLGTSLENSR